MTKGTDYTGITVSYIIIDKKKGVLSSLRSEKCRDERNKRDLGGGGLKFNETLADGVKREIKEELNLDENQYYTYYLGVREIFREHEKKPTHRIGFEYLVILKQNTQVKNMEPEKHKEIRFFPLNSLPKKEETHSQYYSILREFKKQIESITGLSLILTDD